MSVKRVAQEGRELETSNHTFLRSSLNSNLSSMCEKGQVKIYNSICNSLDPETVAVVSEPLQRSTHPVCVPMVESRKQDGVCDCGLFAIASATAEAFAKSTPQKVLSKLDWGSPNTVLQE